MKPELRPCADCGQPCRETNSPRSEHAVDCPHWADVADEECNKGKCQNLRLQVEVLMQGLHDCVAMQDYTINMMSKLLDNKEQTDVRAMAFLIRELRIRDEQIAELKKSIRKNDNEFQSQLLSHLQDHLDEIENEIARRVRCSLAEEGRDNDDNPALYEDCRREVLAEYEDVFKADWGVKHVG